MTTPNPWSRYDRRVLACSRPRSRRHQAAAASHIRADSICPSHFYLLAATWDKYVTKYVFQQCLNCSIKTDAVFSCFLLSPLPPFVPCASLSWMSSPLSSYLFSSSLSFPSFCFPPIFVFSFSAFVLNKSSWMVRGALYAKPHAFRVSIHLTQASIGSLTWYNVACAITVVWS